MAGIGLSFMSRSNDRSRPIAVTAELCSAYLMSKGLERSAAWGLLYLWSVPVVMLFGDVMNFQYDSGGLGFWLVAAYSLPAHLVIETVRSVENPNLTLAAICYFVPLVLASAAFLLFRRRTTT